RAAGWQTVTIPGSTGATREFTITCDGSGRFVYDRLLSTGLREKVICDGKTLVHLYPELGIGARRRFSRFHHVEFARLVPWALPSAEELARGADVRFAGNRTVIIAPRATNPVQGHDGKELLRTSVHLMFTADGRVVERRLVDGDSGHVLYREQYQASGTVRLLDAHNRELVVHKRIVHRTVKPDLNLDCKPLVVLPLPLRTWKH